MGAIREEVTGQVSTLESNHLIGRHPRCSLRLGESSVSNEHASLRWSGRFWLVKDLGSRFGTFLDAQPLRPGVTAIVRVGARLAFGRERNTWVMTDDGAPRLMVVPAAGGLPLFPSGGMIAIPSADHPAAVVYEDKEGRWVLDQGGRIELMKEHVPFTVEGAEWRLCNASPLQVTSMHGAGRETMGLDEVRLTFRVSRNEEHVEIAARWRDRTVDLGARSHHYVLLTLARVRLADATRGEPPPRAGWIEQDELLRKLQVGSEKLNVDIFRARKQLGECGFVPAATIVERRLATKELRIGVGELAVETV